MVSKARILATPLKQAERADRWAVYASEIFLHVNASSKPAPASRRRRSVVTCDDYICTVLTSLC